MSLRVLIRGGGDLGTGVVLRLFRAGAMVLVTELSKPLVVRRKVAVADAIYSGKINVEGVTAVFAKNSDEVENYLEQKKVPVVIDPEAKSLEWYKPHVLIDARLIKNVSEFGIKAAEMVIGLGPGFTAGVDCHAVVETKRGPSLGRVYWYGTAEVDSRLPEMVNGYVEERVLRSPNDGIFISRVQIGDFVQKNQLLGDVDGSPIYAVFDGIVRGLVADGLEVSKDFKIGDIDPRKDPRLCWLVSDKALAIGGGVLEAILTNQVMRKLLCE